jgi:CheY-like chemotaxis protein
MNVDRSKILVFDDDQDLCTMLQMILNKRFTVKIKNDVKSAVQDIINFHPDFILMDLNIPEVGGEETAKIIKQTDGIKNTPLYLFSANSNILDAVQRSNADGYIKKPCVKDVLMNTISSALTKS